MNNPAHIRKDIYERLKFWDNKRAEILKHHQKSVQQIQAFLEKRIADSKQYIVHLKNNLQYRIHELKTYYQNSIMNSQYVLDKNKYQAYAAHYDLLKDLICMEASQVKQIEEKISDLQKVYKNLQMFTDSENSHNEEEESTHKLDGSSIQMVRSNVRYMIQCELEDIVAKVIQLGEKVSESYNNNNDQEDLYICMLNFVHQTHRQSAKHREIGRQLLTLVSATMKREIKIQQQIRQCLKQWSEIDGPIDQIFIEQMQKKDVSSMIKHFYDLNEIANIQFEEPTIEDFLINFRIFSFTDHEHLKICEVQGFYNKQIQTKIIVTIDKFVHLLRLNNPKPDFSFPLTSQFIIHKKKQTCIVVTKYKKRMLFKREKQYEFEIEFEQEQQYSHFKNIIEKISDCRIK